MACGRSEGFVDVAGGKLVEDELVDDRVTEVATLEGLTALDRVDPELVNPELVNPELFNPELVDLELLDPELEDPVSQNDPEDELVLLEMMDVEDATMDDDELLQGKALQSGLYLEAS